MDVIVPCEDLKCVQVLIDQKKIKSLSLAQKKQLITSPKPTPNLCISQRVKSHQRQFNRSVYKTHWIVGCSHSNKLYCWCCIFFSNDKTVWNSSGYRDLNNLNNAIKRHAYTQKHLNAVVSFSNFGKQRIKTCLSPQLSEEISKYNTQVKNNRSVFQRLVDIVCHLAVLAQQECPLRCHVEPENSLNEGKFSDLVTLLSKYDIVLEKHIMQHQQSDKPESMNISNNIQKDIINSVIEVMKSRIDYELKQTKFVSIIIDEIPCHRKQLCLILRYYYRNETHNRLMGFINTSQSCTPGTLSNMIIELLKKHECIAKLVAQSYNSASVITSLRNKIQEIVKNACPQAISFWCNAHTLALVMYNICNTIGEVSLFFSALRALCNFFCNSSKRAAYYDTYCSKKLPNATASLWTYVSLAVNIILEQKSKLIVLFSDLCDSDNLQDWDGDTILAAENIENTLRSFNFNFFLLIFHQLFEKTDYLNNILQKLPYDVDYCSNKIKEFLSWLRVEYQPNFNQIYENVLLNNSPPRLRRDVRCAETEYRRLFNQVIDNIYTEINDRYAEIHKLKFCELLNNKKFENYHLDFPTGTLDALFDIYPNYFDEQVLKNQLICLYSSPEFRDRNVFELIDFIKENNFEDAFSALLKLAYLVETIPASSSSHERDIMYFKRTHTYISNIGDQKRLAELSMIAMEKQLLIELKRSPTFYSDVIKSFLKRERRYDLEYK